MRQNSPHIRIFVSMRIDVDSVLINNPLYTPVRCGAVFDPENKNLLQGDDTGNHISEKRASFCEFTVQYWAWKNVPADYYGLCHYRRYLAFSEKRLYKNDHGLVPCPALLPRYMKRFGLLDAERMRKIILRHDMVIPQPAPVSKMPLPVNRARTVQEMWEAHDGIFFDKRVIIRMFELIDIFAPQYSRSAREYFAGDLHRGYNCYIMRRPYFERLCRFQFPIMEALEKELNATGCPQEMRRTPAYIGEMLFGIFIYHILKVDNPKVCELPLVLFEETAPPRNGAELIYRYLIYGLDQVLRKLAAPLFPLGSRRRKVCKRVYRKIVRR